MLHNLLHLYIASYSFDFANFIFFFQKLCKECESRLKLSLIFFAEPLVFTFGLANKTISLIVPHALCKD